MTCPPIRFEQAKVWIVLDQGEPFTGVSELDRDWAPLGLPVRRQDGAGT